MANGGAWAEVEKELGKLKDRMAPITSARQLIRDLNDRLEELTIGVEVFPVEVKLEGRTYQLGYGRAADGNWQLCFKDENTAPTSLAGARAPLVILATDQLVPVIDVMTDQIGAILATVPASATAGVVSSSRSDTADALRNRVERRISKLSMARHFVPKKGEPFPLDHRFAEYAMWIFREIREAMKDPADG